MWRLFHGGSCLTEALVSVVNTKSCRHFSDETVRHSILIFIDVVSNILKLCTLVFVCPSVRLLGQHLRLNLGGFSHLTLGDMYSLLSALLRVILFAKNHFISLTLRPGGAYVFRPDTFLVTVLFRHKLFEKKNEGHDFSDMLLFSLFRAQTPVSTYSESTVAVLRKKLNSVRLYSHL